MTHQAYTAKHAQPGETKRVFDAFAWREAGYDQPDGNEQFWRSARILRVYRYDRNHSLAGEEVADVEWLHSGKVTHGHFTDVMRDA